MRNHIVRSLALALLLIPAVGNAAGTSPVGWVSKQFGNDVAGCGSVANPCKTLQFAHDQSVVAGGTIVIRDSGGYGPITIHNSISIINESGATAGIFGPTGPAIDVQASPQPVGASVMIKGLTLEGAGTGTIGVNGAYFDNLTIANCTIRGFGVGVKIAPTAGSKNKFAILESLITSNQQNNVWVFPASGALNGLLKNVTMSNGGNGIFVDGTGTSGQIQISVDDSVATGNAGVGVGTVSGSTPHVVITADRVDASSNNYYGFSAETQAQIVLTRSKAFGNGSYDVDSMQGEVKSAGDNLVGNILGALGAAPYK